MNKSFLNSKMCHSDSHVCLFTQPNCQSTQNNVAVQYVDTVSLSFQTFRRNSQTTTVLQRPHQAPAAAVRQISSVMKRTAALVSP